MAKKVEGAEAPEKAKVEKPVDPILESARLSYKSALNVFAEAKAVVISTRTSFRAESARVKAEHARKPKAA
jgi:hypothetical protein